MTIRETDLDSPGYHASRHLSHSAESSQLTLYTAMTSQCHNATQLTTGHTAYPARGYYTKQATTPGMWNAWPVPAHISGEPDAMYMNA